MATRLREPPLPEYETDAAGWAEAQAAALRERRVDRLDWENLAVEIADVSGRERDKIVSALRVLLLHLLKWDHQPARRSRSWWRSVAEQRGRIADGLDENPSLRPRVAWMIARAYRDARRDAAVEMRVFLDALPAECPYHFEEMINRPVEWNGEIA